MSDSASEEHTGKLPPNAASQLDLQLPSGTLQRFLELRRQHGDIFALDLPGDGAQAYVVSHPDFAKQVFCTNHSHYRRHILDGHLTLVLGQGLLISEGAVWKAQRKLLQRCFHGSALAGIVSQTLTANTALVEHWTTCARSGDPIELGAELVRFSIASNFSTLFGRDAPAMLEDIGIDFVQQLTAPSRADTRRNLLLLRQTKQARARIATLIDSRRQRTQGDLDLLAQFMQLRLPDGRPMPDEQIIDEIFSVLLAGHETVASALQSVWYLIARDTAVAARMVQEVDAVIGDTAPTPAQLGALSYTTRVIQEALRLYPPVWVISHRAQCQTRIGDYLVPPGTIVFVCPYLIHRHADFWPEPERFDPDRFAATACRDRHGHAYLPHSVGPRNCIGDDLSMQEMLLHVASVLRCIVPRHVEGVPGNFSDGFTLRTTTPIYLQPQLRQ